MSEKFKYVDKRVRYFDGQYLDVEEFVDEQKYHIDRQQTMNRLLCVSGILEGLDVSIEGNNLNISPGAAIDDQGQQIFLNSQFTIDLNKYDEGKNNLLLSFKRQESDPQDGGENTRFQEVPNVFFESTITSSSVLLAILNKNGSLNLDCRQYSGLQLPAKGGNGVTLRSQNGASDRAILSGSLSISGNVGIGTTSPSAKLSINGGLHVGGDSDPGDNNLLVDGTLIVKGNVGIGTESPKIHLVIGDDDTGLRQEGDGQLAIYTNNQERLRIGTDVGLFFRSFLSHITGSLTISGTQVTSNDNTAFSTLKIGDWIWANGESKQITAKNDNSITIDSAFSLNQYSQFLFQRSWFRISNNGDVGIGIINPSAKLEVVQDGNEKAAIFSGGGGVDIQGVKDNYSALSINSQSNKVALDIDMYGNNSAVWLKTHNTANSFSTLYVDQKGTGNAAYFKGGRGVVIEGNLTVTDNSTFTGSLIAKNGVYENCNPSLSPNYKIDIRGSAFESDGKAANEATKTLLRINDQEVNYITNARGINTVILNPDGICKYSRADDVYSDDNNWNTWAQEVNNNAKEGDVVAVASYDALRAVPLSGQGAELLRSILAVKVFNLVSSDQSSDVRRSYALLFIMGRSGAIEVLQPYRGSSAYITTTYYELLRDNSGTCVSGMIIMWSGAVDKIPFGWVLCDGQNGTPNLRGRFVLGSGQGNGLTNRTPGMTGGKETHQLTIAEMPSHNHTIRDDGHEHFWEASRQLAGTDDNNNTSELSKGDRRDADTMRKTTNKAQTGISIENNGLGQAHENMPPFYVLAFIMKL